MGFWRRALGLNFASSAMTLRRFRDYGGGSAVAVIPFTFLLNGDSPFPRCHHRMLSRRPGYHALITLTFSREGFADSRKLVMIMAS
jgi:hypothetical protein